MGGLFGGGASAPEYQTPEKAPTPQASKDLSAGANAAMQAQRDKQRRNRGLSASIMTNRSGGTGGLASTDTGNTTLG